MDFTRGIVRASYIVLSVILIQDITPRWVLAQTDRDWKFCTSDSDTPEVRAISDCTGLIDNKGLSESDRAKAYYRRGAAYWRKS